VTSSGTGQPEAGRDGGTEADWVPGDLNDASFATPSSRPAVPDGKISELPFPLEHWEDFEKLLVALAADVDGLVEVRRYGTPGQEQDGIDVIGLTRLGHRANAYQCKNVGKFDESDLARAIARFVDGSRPFGPERLVVAVATAANRTQLLKLLEDARAANPGLTLELWDAAKIGELLRVRPRIVERFFGEEVTRRFCLSASFPASAGPDAVRAVVGYIPRASAAFQDRPGPLRTLMHPAPDDGSGVVFAVTGLRGAGKSQLAAACARRRLDAGWRMVAWINAEDREQLLGGYAELAATLKLSGSAGDSAASAARVRNWLEADGTDCLLVLDNATDADLVQQFLPAAGRSHTIITSSRQAFADLGISVAVDAFTKEQAAGYLAKRTRLADETGAAAVGQELGYLPLALAQAAAVVYRQHLDYATYLRRLAEAPVADYLTRDEFDPYTRRTAEAIILSADAAQRGENGGVCRLVLEVVCLLSSAGTSRGLLPAAVGEPDAAVDDALQQLADWSLLTWSANGSAVVAHRLVMRVVRERANREETLRAAAGCAIAALRIMMPPLEDESPDHERAQELVEQIIALAGNLAPHTGSIDAAQGMDLLLLRGWAGWYLTARKDFSRAIPLLEQVVADRATLWGPDDEATRTARTNLASAYLLAGRLKDAIPLTERDLADAEQLLGSDDEATLTARGNLANAYEQAGRLRDAMPLLKRNAALSKKLLGRDHLRTLAAVNNLAVGYKLAGRFEKALQLHKQNLADRLQVLDPDHPYTLTARNNLANTYLDAGRRSAAIPLYEQTLADRLRVLGPDHPDTLQSRNNLANAYVSDSRLEEAIPLHEQALAGRQQILGPDHPETLGSLSNLGGAYQKAGRLQDAIALFKQALAGSEQTLGADHPTTREHREKLRRALALLYAADHP
jgi:tetratricopeptide (TPR) repeat protein